jgi:uroporphyrinogen decarboxylase
VERWKQILGDIRNRNAQPDIGRLIKAIRREGEPDRVPLFELFADGEIMGAILAELRDMPQGATPLEKALNDRILFYRTLGYDYVQGYFGNLNLELLRDVAEDTAELGRGQRSWQPEGKCRIGTREEFESYPWPDPNKITVDEIEWMVAHVPEGMGVIPMHSGIFEWVTWLMGYETMAIAIYEDEPLIDAMFRRVGSLFVAAMEKAVAVRGVSAVMIGDDMGFKTQPMITPSVLIEKSFPWHKKLAALCHDAGIPYTLHACGNLEPLMEPLIEDVRIDGKHSYEDAIMPVAEAKRRYGDRISILGGVDVDYLCRHSEDEVRAYVRGILRDCGSGTGYALGTGNSVANYIPLANYLAMIDEGLAWRLS